MDNMHAASGKAFKTIFYSLGSTSKAVDLFY
jgi:hypothetical protein